MVLSKATVFMPAIPRNRRTSSFAEVSLHEASHVNPIQKALTQDAASSFLTSYFLQKAVLVSVY